MKIPTTEIAEQATIRLIPTAYYKPPILNALVDNDEEFAILAEIEGLTNQRLKAEQTGLPNLDLRELAYNAWGQSHINAAFSYTRPEGNRFNDVTRGAWYCAYDDLTAIAEVAYHKTRELERIQRFEDEVIYQGLLAGFLGEFHDLRKASQNIKCLNDDPKIAYPAGQQLAAELRGENSRGIIYPSARKQSGICRMAKIIYNFYVRYAVSYRDLEGIMEERGIKIDHAILNRHLSMLYCTNNCRLIDRRFIKKINRLTIGFKVFDSAAVTAAGIEVVKASIVIK